MEKKNDALRRPAYFCLTTEEYAIPSCTSGTKLYFGTLSEMSDFVVALRTAGVCEGLVEAYDQYISGNQEATHIAGFRSEKLLRPAAVHPFGLYFLGDFSWDHLNVYECVYNMRADRVEVMHAVAEVDGKFYRCMKAKFFNLTYSSDLFPDIPPALLDSGFWGHPCVLKSSVDSDGSHVIESRFFAASVCFTNFEEAAALNSSNLLYDLQAVVDDIFGDG